MFDKFEVVLPGPKERAHRPPRGFHTFYINQPEMGLRFPLPRSIASLCQHIKISPSQLAPNSYSFLLALTVLLSYYNIPLILYVLMQLVQVKRLGPGKFYPSHKGDHAFIKGNPSSHKGWMSRFFFVKRVGKKRDPWMCDMSWRDNIYTLTPSTPERSSNLASFLEAMHEQSYNAPELTNAWVKRQCCRPCRRKLRGAPRERPHPGEGGKEEEGFLGGLPFWGRGDGFLCNMVPDMDISRLRGATNSEVVGLFASQLALAKKSLAYFKTGFESCVAQFRANGYSEEEHPAPFLSMRRALEEMPDDDEEAAEEEEEEDDADTTPPPPRPLL
ncbi:hypothetical protein F511_27158 [Dorcoceras hygrometricum]|uniref:Uncharacterized protein n=1 Tax=Dorcoceras hygrometricum TaxID=472368 RepID=A0A2Z7D5S0_9LAMI|nr:hypothetical protein F511_27158 [Dorcoceras hygrometricum]